MGWAGGGKVISFNHDCGWATLNVEIWNLVRVFEPGERPAGARRFRTSGPTWLLRALCCPRRLGLHRSGGATSSRQALGGGEDDGALTALSKV